MAIATPGIDFLARAAISFLLPIIVSVLVFRYGTLTVQPNFSSSIGRTIFEIICIFGGLGAFTCFTAVRVVHSEWKLRRDAARMGARVMPRDQGKLPGNIDALITRVKQLSAYPGEGSRILVDKLGSTFDFNILWSRSIFTVSPEHIKIILATDFSNYEKGPVLHNIFAPLLGTGVFNSDGEMWKFHRSMTRPFFSRDRISHFEIFDRHAEAVIAKMKERLGSGMALDFQDLMGRFTLDSASEFLFGSSVQSLECDLPYPYHISQSAASLQKSPRRSDSTMERFSHAFFQAQEVVSRRTRLGSMWPLLEIWRDDLTEHKKVVDAFIEPIVKEAIRKREVKGNSETSTDIGEDETLLDNLVKLTSDPTILKDEVLNIMLAGRDTTASTLAIATYFLAMYPEVTARLRAEVLAKVGPTRRPTYEDIREMKFLRAVINETLRLYPIVPFNIRFSVNATTWPAPNPDDKPFYVPPKTSIIYSVLMMQRRKDLWGPDAEEFDPDRFLDERLKKYLIPNSFAFLPFNAGPRICLGQQFAYNEMSFMLIRLLQNFDSFRLDGDAQPPSTKPPAHWKNAIGSRQATEQFWPTLNFTLHAKGGLWLKVHESTDA